VRLTAENEGSEVIIRIMDDGAGLNREKILERARANHLFTNPEAELTDREIYSFIFAPGFSTNEKITEFSGRGVGMDVVLQNIKALSGTVSVDSTPGQGSVTTLRIPLTLAIIRGMSIAAGQARYTIPITSIRQSFRPEAKDVFQNPDGGEMIMVRGECYPIVRLYEVYHVQDAVRDIDKGILVLVETDKKILGIFADCLLGVQEIVVKPVPAFIQKISNTHGITGCTLLGDGSISLILDAQSLSSQIYS
jgi:two-component system, chemotaxis family, sensor kinase CheA